MKNATLTAGKLLSDKASRKLLETMLRSTTMDKVLKRPGSPAYTKAMTQMAESIIHAHRRMKGGLKGKTLPEMIRNSNHYKWSQITTTSKDPQQTARLLRKRIGSRVLAEMYKMGGFQWKGPHATALPAATKPKTKKPVRQTPPARRQKAPGEEKESLNHQLDRLKAAIEEQKNTASMQVAALKEQLDALPKQIAEAIDLISNHRHAIKIQGTEAITGKPVTVTTIARKGQRQK